MKALLIRVAVDTTGTDRSESSWSSFRQPYPNGGFWGPVWEDGRFEYIPVPEIDTESDGEKPKDYLEGEQDENTYGTSRGDRLDALLSEWIPKSKKCIFEKIATHYDPNFRECTYGDVYTPKGQQCAELGPGDLLVFCASQTYYGKNEDNHGLFIIGYFTVKEVHPFQGEKFKDPLWREKIVTKYWNRNAHFSKPFARGWGWADREEMRHWYLTKKEDNLILIEGKDPGKCSGLLKKAIPITEMRRRRHGSRLMKKYFYIKKDIAKGLGLGHSPDYEHLYERGVRWIKDKNCIEYLKEILKKGYGFHMNAAS